MNDQIYEKIVQKLIEAGVKSPRLEARLLIADVLEIDVNAVHSSIIVSQKLQEKLKLNVSKRIQGMPLDKILRHKGFYRYDFLVSEDVLSPRPETEVLVEEALALIKDKHIQNIADLGVGSGCILLSILKENPFLFGVGVDVSPYALKVADENAKKLDIKASCRFIQKNWFDEDFPEIFEHRFDLIVSNPPYIKTEEIETLDIEVKKYDPLCALDGGKDGLKDYRRLSEIMPKILNGGGYLLLEIGLGQAQDVRRIFENHGLKHIKTLPDLAGIERVVVFISKA